MTDTPKTADEHNRERASMGRGEPTRTRMPLAAAQKVAIDKLIETQDERYDLLKAALRERQGQLHLLMISQMGHDSGHRGKEWEDCPANSCEEAARLLEAE